MNWSDEINRATKLKQSCDENVTWSKIVQKKEKKTPIRRGHGEPPLDMGEYESNFVPLNSDKKYQNTGTIKKEKSNSKHKRNSKRSYSKENSKQSYAKENSTNNPNSDESLELDFSTITAIVREVTGGYNTMSNAVAEKFFKERQEHNESLDSSFNTAASSSQTTCSYKTALEDPTILSRTFPDQDIKSENSFDEKFYRYKRNALVTGVLREKTYNSSDIESLNESSALDASDCQLEIESGMNTLNLNKAEQESKSMQNDRLNMFFQSKEDPDVYYHALKELPNDPDWKNYRLKRKGIETTKTPRQYYFSLDDDEIGLFEKQK